MMAEARGCGCRKAALCSIRTLGSNPLLFQLGKQNNNSGELLFYFLAEARGFEPPERLPAHTLSKRAPSTTRPHFQYS